MAAARDPTQLHTAGFFIWEQRLGSIQGPPAHLGTCERSRLGCRTLSVPASRASGWVYVRYTDLDSDSTFFIDRLGDLGQVT